MVNPMLASRMAQFQPPTSQKKTSLPTLPTKTSSIAVKSIGLEPIPIPKSPITKFTSSVRTNSSGSNGISIERDLSLITDSSSTSSDFSTDHSVSDTLDEQRKRIQVPKQMRVIPVNPAFYQQQQQVLQDLSKTMQMVSRQLDCSSLNTEHDLHNQQTKDLIKLLEMQLLSTQNAIYTLRGEQKKAKLFANLLEKTSEKFSKKIRNLFKDKWLLKFNNFKLDRDQKKILSHWAPDLEKIKTKLKDIDSISKSEIFSDYVNCLYDYREKLVRFIGILRKFSELTYEKQHVLANSFEKFFEFIAPHYSEEQSKLAYVELEVSSHLEEVAVILKNLLETDLNTDPTQKKLNQLLRSKHFKDKELLFRFFSVIKSKTNFESQVKKIITEQLPSNPESKQKQVKANLNNPNSFTIISTQLNQQRQTHKDKLKEECKKIFTVLEKINEEVTREIQSQDSGTLKLTAPEKITRAKNLYKWIADEIADIYVAYLDKELIKQIKKRLEYCEEEAAASAKQQQALETKHPVMITTSLTPAYKIGQRAAYFAETIKSKVLNNIQNMVISQDAKADWDRAIKGGTLSFLNKDGKSMLDLPIFSSDMTTDEEEVLINGFIYQCNRKFAEALFEDDTLFNNFHKICKQMWFDSTTEDTLEDHAQKSLRFFAMVKKDQTNVKDVQEILFGKTFQLDKIVKKIMEDPKNAQTIIKFAKIWTDANQSKEESKKSLLTPEAAVIYSLIYLNSLLYICPSQALGWGVVYGPLIDGFVKTFGGLGDTPITFNGDKESCETRLIQVQVAEKEIVFTILQAANFGYLEQSQLIQELKLRFPLIGQPDVNNPIDINLILRLPSTLSPQDKEKLEISRVKFSHLLSAAGHNSLKVEEITD